MKKTLKQSLKAIAIELPIYAVFVTVYILVVLKFLGQPLSDWFKSDRRLYAAVGVGLIIGQGFMLELATRVMGRHLKKQRPLK